MPLTYTYPDAYLGPLITQAREDQATADVAILGPFPAAYTAKLIVLQAYLIVCRESQQRAEDTFALKLTTYQREFDRLLPLARAAQQAASLAASPDSNAMSSPFTVELFRG